MRRRIRKIKPQVKKNESPFFSPNIQTRLKMGKAGDKYEVEADKMADKVVNKSHESNQVQKKEGEEEIQTKPLAAEATPFVQRMEGNDEESVQMMEEEAVQRKEDDEIQKMEEEEAVQSKEDEEVQAKEATTTSNNSSNSFENKLRKGNGGSKMDSKTKVAMETGFGADFSDVKIHHDAEATNMSGSIGAQAFTHGNDIYFNKGKYNPTSKEGKHLLAHELTHTVQQKGMVQKKIQRQTKLEKDLGKGKSAKGSFDPLTGIYTVQKGDNLTAIASRYGTSIAKIVTDNPEIKDPNSISVGQKIFISKLIMPNDPTGKNSNTVTFDDYVKRWEAQKGRKITASEKSTLERGCVGVTAVNIQKEPLSNLDECYSTFEAAIGKAREINDNYRKLGLQDKKKAVIFSKRFWSGGKSYAPDKTGKVDLSDYNSRLNSGDAWRPDDKFHSGYINFDYGFYNIETGMWWHANHSQPGMEVYESTLEYYSRKLLDFDKQVFCVVITDLK